MDPSWSNGGKPPDNMMAREQRKARIEPFWEDLSDDREPRATKPVLLQLMQDLKDEGNTLFKETLYDLAWMHYRNALFVARMLETRFYYEVKKDFISTLFSNRALCCLKKELFEEAVSDCDSAIRTQPTNLKAYYRKVQALKALGRYQDALHIARTGFSKQPTVFKELLEELQAICQGTTQRTPGSNQPTKKTSQVSINDARPSVKEHVDNEWLQDTNALRAEKQREAAIAKMPKKKKATKSNGVKSEPVQPQVQRESSTEESEADSDGLGEDEKFAKQLQSVRTNVKRGPPFKITQPKVPKEEEAWAFPHSPDTDIDLVPFSDFKKVGAIGTKAPTQPSMGLDDFSTNRVQNEIRGNSVPRSSPDRRSPKTNVRPPQIEVDWPLKDEFDFQLACKVCFQKIGEGVKGYRYNPFKHNCGKFFLLIRLKEKENLNWLKVRPRAESQIHRNASYKICQQFQSGVPCRVGEERCTFPHHQPELRLWTMDRDGVFSVKDFIEHLKKIGLDTSIGTVPATSVTEPVKKPEIPGMNYQTSTTSRPQPVSQSKLAGQTQPPNSPQNQTLYPTPSPSKVRPQDKQPPIMHPPPNFAIPPPDFRVPPPPAAMVSPPIFSPAPGAYPGPSEYSHPLQMHPDGDASSGEKMENPLALSHEFKIMCKQCLVFHNFPGRYVYNPHQHLCEENMLAMRARQGVSPWFRVRERKNHREFPGNYVVCNSVQYNRPDWCHYGEESCSFAHNMIEQRLWTVEKDGGNFNVTEFIMQNRSSSKNRGFSLAEILAKHGGNFDFICRNCYYSQPPRISSDGRNGYCNGIFKHPWQSCSILSHFDPNGAVTVINSRGFMHKTAFFKICKWLHFCKNSFLGTCRFAHSMVERDVWMLERDTGLTRAEIVHEANVLLGHMYSPQPPLETRKPTPPPQVATQTKTAPAPQTSTTPPLNLGHPDCPFNVQIICGICWKTGGRSPQDGSKDRCAKGHNLWHQIRIFQVQPSLKEVRALPRKIPTNYHFIVCKYVREKKKCDYNLGGPCQFAHGEEELEIWKWMCQNNVKTLDELAELSRKSQLARAPKPAISQGESVVAVMKAAARVVAPSDLNFNPHYCQYCGVQCNSEKQWDNHCASDKHTFNVNSDRDHQWNHRQPPWGIPASSYEQCAKHVNGERCQYSHVPEMYNLCNYAHSEEELDEWKERYEWRQMKREMAKKQKVFSYMDQLLEKYETSESGIAVMSEDGDGVSIAQPMEPLNVYREDKNASLMWKFTIRSMNPLQKVALLYNRDRLHFSIVTQDSKCHQIAPGDMFEDIDAKGHACYRVDIRFTGGMFGSFSQWVIFDFGTEPVVVRKLSVEVGPQVIHEQVHYLRQKLSFDRWTSLNREIIRPGNNSGDQFCEQLLRKYKEPSSSEQVVTQNSIIAELNRNNYVHKMHKLLELEEMTRHRIISSYNLCTEVEIINQIEDKCAIYPRPGELFARVHLSENLTEDTNAGKLILTSVKKVLVAPATDSKKTVYEANIVREENFNYDGRGKEYLYLCIPPVCVKGLKIFPEMRINLELQFQMNRLHFCRMHYAIDCIKNTDIVFPDIVQVNPEWNERQVLKISSKVLNEDQMAAVRHIVTERTGYTPPFIMYGPFGTGKTETLAQAAMVLLKERKETRILICAQSNSAADLYIVKHLDPFLRKTGANIKLRRIYIKERRVNTVPPEVQKYCIFNAEHSSFDFPTKEDILNHRIVITTVETSLQLSRLGLQGYFTHIFVDEAAQALECETIMPLSLATEKTCIVLTGDHMQICPKVYSAEARHLNFHISLLDRLYQYYESFSRRIKTKTNNPLNIFLSMNYRTKMEILRFISAIFYGGPDNLKAMGNIPSVVELTPLVFHAVQGREVQDTDSTSYYNMSEVEEIVERVEDLYNNWPVEWGERAAQEIEVVTPYYDQVVLIRHTLRKRRPELRRISVDTVHNVQGKEFRALFISTCRTRHLLESSHLESLLESSECDGDIGDFGFLSDPKLLNTALTRAKSYVSVVGDPVALCAIGECVQVWRTYLKHCANMKSFYPQTISYDSIKTKVLDLQMSPMGMKLKEVTEMSRQASTIPRVPRKEASRLDNDSNLKGWQQGTQPTPPQPSHTTPRVLQTEPQPKPLTQPLPQPIRPLGTNGFMSAPPPPLRQLNIQPNIPERIDRSIESDDIMRQLVSEGGNEHHLKTECIRVQEENGHAVVQYDTQWGEENQRMMQMSSSDQEADSDVEAFDEKQGGPRRVLRNFDESHLYNLLQSKPDRYKHCKLHIESSEKMFATVAEFNSPIHHIKINSRRHCGQAFNNDEVVVEILDHEEHSDLHGRVVGIIHRAIHPTSIPFVCTVEPNNTGILIPLNKGIPRIYNLTTKTYAQNAKRGQISVYQFTRGKRIELKHYETVDPSDPSGKLFVVRYLKWDPSFYFPFGIVVGVLPAGRTVDMGMKVLDMEHHIPQKYRSETEDEVFSTYHHNYQMPQEVYTRTDLRDKWCFTIETPEAQDIDHAISIEQAADGMYEVAVHISDVEFFLQRESHVDVEALNRGTSFYPLGKEPLHMLPPRLSTELCSILPNVDRLSLSVFMTVNGSGEITKIQLKKCIVNCKRRFSFKEAEETLLNPEGAQTDYFTSCMVVLYQVALLWRRNRLGNDYLCQNLEPGDEHTPRARLLKEELMITANHQVSKKLIGAYPQSTPLKCQRPMNPQEAEEWKEKHAADAINTVALTKPFLDGTRTCKCRVACTCIFTFIRQRGVQAQGAFDIQKGLWRTLCAAADAGNYELVQQLIVAPENHPQLSIAQAELARIQEGTFYVCSGDEDANIQGHNSLNVTSFTSFTSPLRSYMDVVVQRLLSAVIDNLSCPYSKQDIQNLCHHCNNAVSKSNEYNQAVLSLHLAGALRNKPLVAFPVVENVDDTAVSLLFPTIKNVPDAETEVPMSLLSTSDKPEVSADPVEVKVRWQERVYDTVGPNQSRSHGERIKELNPDKFVYKVPAFHWQRLLNAIREEDFTKLQSMLTSVREQVDGIVPDGHFAEDICSESSRGVKVNHFVDFSLKMHPSMVMRVQIVAEITKALLQPRIQLLNLTPTFDICLEHRSSPLTCFSHNYSKPASQLTYTSEIEYQMNWRPVLSMESASRAVCSQESVIIHNVSIEWKATASSSYTGRMSLPVSFFKERKIKFIGDISLEDFLEQGNTKLAQSFFQDFLCVRYSGLQFPQDPNLPDRVSALVDESEPVTWVGHCIIQSVHRESREQLKVTLELHQSSIALPDKILGRDGKTMACTVEWIPRTLLDRHRTYAVQCLVESSALAKDIATGKNPADLKPFADTDALLTTPVESLKVPNQSQLRVLQNALREPFTLVQGPPGTGKTMTAARLAYLFCQRNKNSSTRSPAQVLVCGPTNKSVDVLAAMLKSIGDSCPRLVRVYSEKKERSDYPLPGDAVQPKKRKPPDVSLDPLVKGIALHELIRQPSNLYSQQIQEFDTLFGLYQDGVSDDQIGDYMKIITAAATVELQQAEIILTTCSASASPKMSLGTNIQQVIIDECGMCTEPEAMIPIVLFRDIKQVVLFGDQHQLQPKIAEQATRELGLGKSLLERYTSKATMLTTQYRMHEGIAEFPAHYFYSDRLECGSSVQLNPAPLSFWPSGRNQPVVFCHVAGVEDIQAVALVEGSQQSRSNEREVHYAVTVATTLVNKFRVRESDIVVLSQHHAQCTAIQKKLQVKGLRKITVCTVLDSQGSEWDYVIISTVRSMPKSNIECRPTAGWIQRNMGSLSDHHQVTVAITRARKGLVIIGNKYLLQCDLLWSDLLQAYNQQLKLVDADDFLRLMT